MFVYAFEKVENIEKGVEELMNLEKGMDMMWGLNHMTDLMEIKARIRGMREREEAKVEEQKR